MNHRNPRMKNPTSVVNTNANVYLKMQMILSAWCLKWYCRNKEVFSKSGVFVKDDNSVNGSAI